MTNQRRDLLKALYRHTNASGGFLMFQRFNVAKPLLARHLLRH
jgi:hypothetical protein